MTEIIEESTVAAIARRSWGALLEPSVARFDEPGWSFEQAFESLCMHCSGALHLLGKPYLSNGKTYRYAALVCPTCQRAFTLHDLGFSSRAALEMKSKKMASRPSREALTMPDVPSLGRSASESAPLQLRQWLAPNPSSVEAAVVGAAADLGVSLTAAEELHRQPLGGPTTIEAVTVRGDSGTLWMVMVRHESLTWGCVSSEVRVIHPVGTEEAVLHVATEECREHPAAGVQVRPFPVRVAAGAEVAIEGTTTPFRVGNTTLQTVGRLVAILQSPNRRTPILLLSGAQARERADALLPRVAGGVLVATIDGDASWRLSDALGADMGCYAGAVRIYPPFRPGLRASDCPVWVSRRVAQHGWNNVADDIVATVASTGRVPRRPAFESRLLREAGTRTLREAARENERLRNQLKEAKRSASTSPDIDEIFDAQAAEIDRLQELVLAADLEREDQARIIADLRALLESEVSKRQGLELALKHSHWHHSPDVTAQVVASADETVEDAIERMGDPTGPLACTEGALKSWKAARYPQPQRMLDALLRLEEAALRWRTQEAEVGERLADWLHSGFGLRVALDDAGLRRAGRDAFTFEGKSWSRIPHVKVDDAKHSDQVGRIYFAIDAPNRRWIVDHVGQKLYGR